MPARATVPLALLVLLLQAPALPAQDCDACGPAEAPRRLTARATIAPPGEPGERLVVTGTVFRPDGRTPAPNVIVYAYHTNAVGVYPKRGDERGVGRWHGYLRGWVRTDARGRYEFRTIRPGTYPTRVEPAHIHLEVKPPTGPAYGVQAIVDSADPLVNERYRASLIHHRGGTGILPFTRDSTGVWRVRCDITLEP